MVTIILHAELSATESERFVLSGHFQGQIINSKSSIPILYFVINFKIIFCNIIFNHNAKFKAVLFKFAILQ
jgi:hypothetical protein